MEDTQTLEHSPRLLVRILTALALVVLTPVLGERAWWIVPLIVFTGLIVMALIDRRRPLTARWVLLFGAVGVALAVVLKLTE
jgi:hypothetical protein